MSVHGRLVSILSLIKILTIQHSVYIYILLYMATCIYKQLCKQETSDPLARYHQQQPTETGNKPAYNSTGNQKKTLGGGQGTNRGNHRTLSQSKPQLEILEEEENETE